MTCAIDKRHLTLYLNLTIVGPFTLIPEATLFLQIDGNCMVILGIYSPTRASFFPFCKVTRTRQAWQWSALVSSRRFRTS